MPARCRALKTIGVSPVYEYSKAAVIVEHRTFWLRSSARFAEGHAAGVTAAGGASSLHLV
eukprot:2278956-Heterocapsa_arctica.AAC.1